MPQLRGNEPILGLNICGAMHCNHENVHSCNTPTSTFLFVSCTENFIRCGVSQEN
jgi:hypothetical protein